MYASQRPRRGEEKEVSSSLPFSRCSVFAVLSSYQRHLRQPSSSCMIYVPYARVISSPVDRNLSNLYPELSTWNKQALSRLVKIDLQERNSNISTLISPICPLPSRSSEEEDSTIPSTRTNSLHSPSQAFIMRDLTLQENGYFIPAQTTIKRSNAGHFWGGGFSMWTSDYIMRLWQRCSNGEVKNWRVYWVVLHTIGWDVHFWRIDLIIDLP